MSGNCQYVAERISEILDCDLIRIEPEKAYPDKGARKFYWGGKSAVMGEKPKLKKYEFNQDEYDCVILGFPVWASNVVPPIRTFINENDLSNKKVAAYACYSGGGADKAMTKLRKMLNRDELGAEMVLIDPLRHDEKESMEKIVKFCALLEK